MDASKFKMNPPILQLKKNPLLWKIKPPSKKWFWEKK